MATRRQNELWNSLHSETKKQILVMYFEGKSNKDKVEFLETLYGKDNLENEKS